MLDQITAFVASKSMKATQTRNISHLLETSFNIGISFKIEGQC